MADWSFLTNHGLVLTYVGRHPDSTGRGLPWRSGSPNEPSAALWPTFRPRGIWSQNGWGDATVTGSTPLNRWGTWENAVSPSESCSPYSGATRKVPRKLNHWRYCPPAVQ